MDTDAGRFVEDEKAETWMQRLDIGEVVKIKGEELEVVKIEGRLVVLKLLNSEERFANSLDVATSEKKPSRKPWAKKYIGD